MTDYVETATGAIEAIEAAAERLANAVRMEMELEDQRPIVKSAAIQRLLQATNPETGKPHSASSAEKVVEADSQYDWHRQRQRMAVVETITARGAYEAAKRRADVAIDLGLALGTVTHTEAEPQYNARQIIRALQDYARERLGPNMPASAALEL